MHLRRGGHSGARGTVAGRQGSARYNNALRSSTLRHAVIGPLKSPPKGFEDVTRRHFELCRKRLLVQAKVWALEARETDLGGRFASAYSELLGLLSNDTLSVKDNAALPPLADDLQALRRLDVCRYNELFGSNDDGGRNTGGNIEDDDLNDTLLAHALELSLLGNA